MGEIAQGNIGEAGKYDVEFKDGFLVVTGNAELPPGESIYLSIKVDSNRILDAIQEAVPGKIDDAVIAVIRAVLKQVA